MSTNSWSDAGHGVSQIYDILYMMGRDDVAVGMGGEGGIAEDGHLFPDVGGFLPLAEQVGPFNYILYAPLMIFCCMSVN